MPKKQAFPRETFSFIGIALLLGLQIPVSAQLPAPQLAVQYAPPAMTDFLLSPDGNWLAAAPPTTFSESWVGIWDAETGYFIRRLNELDVNIGPAIAFSWNGRWLAATVETSEYSEIKVWEIGTWKEVVLPTEKLRHASSVASLAFSPRDDRLAAGDASGRIRIWDTASWAALPVLTGGQKKLPPKSSFRSIDKLSFSSDRHFLAGITSSGVVLTWQLDNKRSDPLEQKIPDSSVLDFGFLPDTHRLSILSLSDGTTHVRYGTPEAWQLDYDTGNRTGPLEAPSQTFESKNVLNGKHLRFAAVAYASAGKWLLESPGVVDLYDAQTRKHLGQVSTGRVEGGIESIGTTGIVISQNGTRMALTSKNGPVDFVDLKTGSVLRRSRLHVSIPARLVSSADDRSLAILGIDNSLTGSVTILDRFGSDPMNTLNGGCAQPAVASDCVVRSEPARLTDAVVFLPPLQLSTPTPQGFIAVLTTDLQTGQVKTIAGPFGLSPQGDQTWQKDVTLARFSSDGHWLALARLSEGSRAFGISGASYQKPISTTDPVGIRIWEFNELGAHPAYTIQIPELNALALSPTGRYLATETPSGVVKTWELTTNGPKELWTGTTNDVPAAPPSDENRRRRRTAKDNAGSLVFSQDGQWLAEAVSGDGVRIWKSEDGNEQTIPFGSSCGVGTIVFMGDDTLAVSCWLSSDIRILDRRIGRETKKLKSQTGFPTDIAYFGNRKLILSTTSEGVTLLWDPIENRELGTFISLSSPPQGDASAGDSQWLAVTPEGLFDGSADAMEWVAWRGEDLNEIMPLGDFFNDYYEPGLLSEIMAGANPKPTVDVASILRIPGLRAMVHDNKNPPPVSLLKIGDGAYACFQQEPTALNPVNVDPVRCKYGLRLPYSGDPDELIAALNKPSETYKNPWEGKKAGDTSISTLHVLTVAIDNYPPSAQLFQLPSSVSTADELEGFFDRQGAASNKLFAAVHIWHDPPLRNGNATREAIRERLRDMAKSIKEDDVVFLFLAGHGGVPKGQEMFYFDPVDSRGDSPEARQETGLSTAMLAEALRDMPARRVVLIIDACQSGGVVDSLGKIGEVKAKAEVRREELEAQAGTAAAGHQHAVGVYIIAATTPVQLGGQTPGASETPLATALLEALKTRHQSGDNTIWMQEVVQYIRERLPNLSSRGGAGLSYTPLPSTSGADFPIARTP
jgi:WD40 repeat protein